MARNKKKEVLALTREQIKKLCEDPANAAFFRKEHPEWFTIEPVADVITLKSTIEDIKFDVYLLNPDFVWSIEELPLQKGKSQQVLRVQTIEPHF